jgi:fructosamine-3-kinase
MNTILPKEIREIKTILKKSCIRLVSSFSITKIQKAPRVYKIINNRTIALKIFPIKNKDYVISSMYFYKLAAKHKIPVPKFISFGNNKNICWIMYEWIEGKVLSQLKTKQERFKSAVEVGKYLRKLHSTKINNSKQKSFIYPIKSNYDFFVNKINIFTQKGVKVISSKDIKKIINITSSLQIEKVPPSLLHGDVTGGNIIIPAKKGESALYFFDPGKIMYGDPMCDLGYSQTSLVSEEFRTGVYEGYILKNRLSKQEYERFKLWRLLRQIVITQRAKYQNDPKAKQLIHKRYLSKLLNNYT